MDPRTWRTHRLVILASAACLAAGCASSAHHISYQSEHVATLPSPVGPSGVGPVLEHGHLAVGGAYSTTFGEAPGLQRAEGAPGHVYATHAFEGSLRGGVGDRWELGGAVEVRHTDVGSLPLAEDVVAADAPVPLTAWTGPSVRVAIAEGAGLTLVGQVELLAGMIAIERELTLTEAGGATTTDTSVDHEPYVIGKAGLSLQVQPVEALTLELGAIVQNQPSIAGHRSGETSCVFVHDCLEDARVTALRTKVLGTPFVSVATEVDIVRFAAAAFLNVGDDEMSAEAARAGARVQAQIVF